MKLLEGTHYRRRLDEPSRSNFGSKEFVDCSMCGIPRDSNDDIARRTHSGKQANQGIRLDKLLRHYKGKHRDAFPSMGRSLLDLGFTISSAFEATSHVEDDAIPSEADMGTSEYTRLEIVASKIDQPPLRQGVGPFIFTAIAEEGQPFWRDITHQVDTIIKTNCITQVIPSAHAIGMEVLRQQKENNVEEHGTGVSRERWMEHTTLSEMVRASGLTFIGTDGEERKVYCPVCPKYRAGDGHEVVSVFGRLHVTRKLI